jgi:hypothetical protein
MNQKIFARTVNSILFAVISIPVSHLDSWKMEAYSGKKPNLVSLVDQKMKIEVRKSASPLFYPLRENKFITGFKIKGYFKGLPVMRDFKMQGKKGFDDFPLRVGFVSPGDKKLTGLKKLFAPAWIKNLYRQLGEDLGISHITFFNLVQNPDLIGTSRTHPNSDLITEYFIELVNPSNQFDIDYKLKKPIDAAAIWLSIDGDDTQSEFEVYISDLSIEVD